MSLEHPSSTERSEQAESKREILHDLAKEALLQQESTIQTPENFAELIKKTPRHWVDQIPRDEQGTFTIKLPHGNEGPFYWHSRIQHFIGPDGAIVKTRIPEEYTLTCNGISYEWENGIDGLSWRDHQGNRLLVGEGTSLQFERKRHAPQTRTAPENASEAVEDLTCVRKSINLPSNTGRPITFFTHPATLAHPEQSSKLVLILPGHNLIGNGQVDNALAQGLSPTLEHPKPGVIYAFVDGPLTVDEHKQWMRKPGEFAQFMDEVRSSTQNVLNIHPAQTEIIAHSGAGGVVASAARNNELHVNKVILADASYGSWAQDLADSGIPMTLSAISNTPTEAGAKAVQGKQNTEVKWIENPQGLDPLRLHMSSLTEAVQSA